MDFEEINDWMRRFKADPDEDRWRALAACKDVETDIFFPTKGDSRKKIDRAKAVCNDCMVKKECLDYSLTFEERKMPGIWGGLTGIERRYERQRRAREQEAVA